MSCRRSVLAAVSGALLLAAPAHAGQAYTINVVGTEGRDDVRIDLQGRFDAPSPDAAKSTGSLIFIGATATTAAVRDGVPICRAETAAVSGRHVQYRCAVNNDDSVVLVIDLRGGNDQVHAQVGHAPMIELRASGGLGNDVITLISSVGTRLLRGDDGDDVLAAPVTGPTAASIEGGNGRDIVDYTGAGSATGVRADLANGTAVLTLQIQSIDGPSTIGTRTDTLRTLEGVTGTPGGDILIGTPAADTLTGGDGPDILDGGAGSDTLLGGGGGDRLVGGLNADVIDGGDGVDEFPAGEGGDSYNTRDGFLERITCRSGDVLVDDLVDVVTDGRACSSISTAQAKHRFDTRLSRRALRVRGGRVTVGIFCPRDKTEPCAGRLRLRVGDRVLASRRYRVRPGRRARVRLTLSPREAARLGARRRATLDAAEVDADGRPRRVVVAVRAARA